MDAEARSACAAVDENFHGCSFILMVSKRLADVCVGRSGRRGGERRRPVFQNEAGAFFGEVQHDRGEGVEFRPVVVADEVKWLRRKAFERDFRPLEWRIGAAECENHAAAFRRIMELPDGP